MRSYSPVIRTLVQSAVVLCGVCCLFVREGAAADDERDFHCRGSLGTRPVFSPNGRWLLAGGSERNGSIGTVSVWDSQTSKLVSNFKPHAIETSTVVFSQEGEWLITAGADTAFHVWSVHPRPTPKTGLLSLARTLQHYTLPASRVGPGQFAQVTGGTKVAISPSSREFASYAMYDDNTPTTSLSSRKHHRSIKIWAIPNGAPSSTSASDADSELHPGPGPKPRLTIPVTQSLLMLAYSPDGKTILAGFISDQIPGGHKRPEIQFIDVETGVLRDTWTFNGDESDGQTLGGALQFSPDGTNLLVCFSGKPTVSVWQVEPKRLVWSSKIWNGWSDAAFSPDGKFLALAARHQEVQLLQLPEFKLVSVGVIPSVFGTSLTFSRDSKSLLVHWERDTIKQFSVEDLISKKRWGLDQKAYRTVGETRQPLVVP